MYPRKKRIILHLNAISYRIPMPVTQVVKCSDGYFDAICPRCLGFQPYEYTLFCPICGQRLSWVLLDYAEELEHLPYEQNTPSIRIILHRVHFCLMQLYQSYRQFSEVDIR